MCLYVLVSIFMGFTIQALYSTMDSWILFESKKSNSQYSNILLFSSLGKSISTLIVGKIFSMMGYDLMPVFYIISALILGHLVYKMQDSIRVSTVKNNLKDIIKLFLRQI